MSNMEFYSESLDDATVVYGLTADTNYPITNIQDRNKNTFFKDSGIAAGATNIVIDFGAARSCNSIVLGNYIATAVSAAELVLECHTADAWVGAQTQAFAATEIESSSLTDKVITFSAQNFRYWRLAFADDAAGDLGSLQFGTIFLGTEWNWAHEPELIRPEHSGYKVTTKESGGGSRFGQIANTTVRRIWTVPYEYIVAAEKTKCETFRDNIFMDERGLSRYPFYWTDDGGTTFYYSRTRGGLKFDQQAYQVWKNNFVFEEEL